MLRMSYICDCGYEDDVEDIESLDGCCFRCHEHRGNVHYVSEMTHEEFLRELANMSEKDIAKHAYAIQICAADICDNQL